MLFSSISRWRMLSKEQYPSPIIIQSSCEAHQLAIPSVKK